MCVIQCSGTCLFLKVVRRCETTCKIQAFWESRDVVWVHGLYACVFTVSALCSVATIQASIGVLFSLPQCCGVDDVTLLKDSVHTSDEKPDPRQPSEKSDGYSGGSMAGLAFGMLLVGAIVGVIGLLFWQRRKHRRQFGYRRETDYTNM